MIKASLPQSLSDENSGDKWLFVLDLCSCFVPNNLKNDLIAVHFATRISKDAKNLSLTL
jgi:hypothetical protein